ncbi:MAG: DNA circularization protein [Polaromonas sp.]
MASWRDNLGKVTLADGRELVGGQFRGIPFHTVDADLKVGRRTVLHEYPQRDVPYVEDLGRRARQYAVEAYVLGDNYFAERDALINAIETAGPGELVHPRYGRLIVAVQDYVTVKESAAQGGIARFSIVFVAAGQNVFPQAEDSTVGKVEEAADATDQAAEDDFGQSYSVQGPSVLSVAGIRALQHDVDALLLMARRATDVSGLASIVGAVAGLTGSMAGLIRTPVVLAQRLSSIYGQFNQALRRPLSAFAELQSVYSSNTRPSQTARAGSSTARSLRNEAARSDLQRRLALSNQARALAMAIADADLVATADQARALRDALLVQIDQELETNDPAPAVASALGALRAAVVRDVSARSEFLKRRGSFATTAVLPALVVAHRFYQDATRADELVLRNGVRNPAFVPATKLEVLL